MRIIGNYAASSTCGWRRAGVIQEDEKSGAGLARLQVMPRGSDGRWPVTCSRGWPLSLALGPGGERDRHGEPGLASAA